MQQRWMIGFGVAVLAIVSWNAWTVTGLSSRIAALEEADGATEDTPGAVQTEVVETTRQERSVAARSTRQDEAADRVEAMEQFGSIEATDLADPEVRDAITQIVEDGQAQRTAEKRDEQLTMYLDSMTSEIRNFADEHSLDSNTRKQVEREVEASTRAWTAIRHDIKDGQLSWFDAKHEFQAIKEDSQANLTAILGEERYEDLRERLWGGWGHGK